MSKAGACHRSIQPNLAWAAFLERNTGHSVDIADAWRSGGVKRFDWWLDAIHDSRSRHGAAHLCVAKIIDVKSAISEQLI